MDSSRHVSCTLYVSVGLCCVSVTFWSGSVPQTNGSGSGSNSGSDSFFPIFFRITCPQAYRLQSKTLNFLLTFFVKILFCRYYFSPHNIFMRNREGSGSVHLTNGSGSATLVTTSTYLLLCRQYRKLRGDLPPALLPFSQQPVASSSSSGGSNNQTAGSSTR
jgi:hypothetical protein